MFQGGGDGPDQQNRTERGLMIDAGIVSSGWASPN